MNSTLRIKRHILCWLLLLYSSWGSILSAQFFHPVLEVDSACATVTVYMLDSSGSYDAARAPYLLEYANLPAQQNNAVAFWRFPVGTLLSGQQYISITDGNGQRYMDSVTFSCGGSPSPLRAQLSNITAASACNVCDGSTVFSITPLSNPTPYILKWSDGSRDTTSSIPFLKTGLCAGSLQVVIEDTLGHLAAAATFIPCPQTLPQINCLDTFPIRLNHTTGTYTLYPEDMVTLNTGGATPNYQLGINGGVVVPTYTFDCNDIGLHNFMVLAVDSTSYLNASCPVKVQVLDDSTGACSNFNGLTITVADSLRDASTCSTCNGHFAVSDLFHSGTRARLNPFSFTYTWNDGIIGRGRTDLCPNQRYELTIWDSVGTGHVHEVQIGCPNNVCLDSNQVDFTLNCPQQPIPVCGCDGRTYLNACIAEYKYGITSWSRGPCSSLPLRIEVQSIPSHPCDTAPCTGAINLTVSGGTPPYRYFWSQGATGPSVNNLCLGNYTVTVVDANSIGQYTRTIWVGQDGCVWPGDADNNGVANHFDLLNIGLGYGTIGPSRAFVNDAWQSYAAPFWNDSTPQSHLNYRYLDCNGDGLIDSSDVDAIRRNYGRYYARTGYYSPLGNVPFHVEDGSGFAGDVVRVPIVLGDSTHPATNVYGLAFTLHYDERYVDTSNAVYIDFSNSWLGSAGSILSVQRDFRRSGEVEIAVTRVDRQAISGIGTIAAVNFTIKDDLFMGRLAMDSIVTPLNVTGVRIIDQQENLLGYNTQTGTIQLNEILDTRKLPDDRRLTVFPNPAQDQLNLVGKDVSLEYLRLYAADGQLVLERALDTLPSAECSISTQGLPVGMYFLEVQTSKGVWQEKIHVQR